MPWGPADAKRFTKKAQTAKQRREWMHVANGELASGKTDGEAVRIANGVIRDQAAKKKKKR